MSAWRLCSARSCCESVPKPLLFCYPCWEWLTPKMQTLITDAWIDRGGDGGAARLDQYVEIAKKRIEREKKAAGA